VNYLVNRDPVNNNTLTVNITQDGFGSGATGSGNIIKLKLNFISAGT
jgi:hypothetical protein